MGKLYISEHGANRTMPPLETQIVEFGQSSKPLYPGTRELRLVADEDCLISPAEAGATIRLAADTVEWFTMAQGHRNICIRVMAEPEE